MTWHLAQTVTSNLFIGQSVASVALIAGALVVRWGLRRGVQRQDRVSAELRRRWLLQVRNLTFALIALGLVLIWATELKTAAISVVAFIVALVLATKELILCLSGGFLKLSSKSFVLGDRVEIGTVRGEVIDQTLLTTKIMEIGSGPGGEQYTGRIVTLPNALMLSTPVMNETLTKGFGLQVLSVPVKVGSEANGHSDAAATWSRHEAALLGALEAVCEPYLDEARRSMAAMSHQEGLDAPSVEPRVHVSIPEPGRVDLIARLAYPTHEKGRVRQAVLRGYLERVAAFESEAAQAQGDSIDELPED